MWSREQPNIRQPLAARTATARLIASNSPGIAKKQCTQFRRARLRWRKHQKLRGNTPDIPAARHIEGIADFCEFLCETLWTLWLKTSSIHATFRYLSFARRAPLPAGKSGTLTLLLPAWFTAWLLVQSAFAQPPADPPQQLSEAAAAAAAEGRITELVANWKTAGVAPRNIHRTLLELVLPENQPAVIRRFNTDISGRSSELLSFERSAGLLLAQYSQAAPDSTEFTSRLQSRLQHPAAAAPATVLLWQQAVLARDPQGLQAAATASATLQPLQLTDTTLEVLAFWMDGATTRLAPHDAEVARTALERLLPAALAVHTTPRCSQHLAGLAMRLARWQLLHDQPEQARTALHIASVLTERAAATQSDASSLRLLAASFHNTARLLVLAGSTEQALEQLQRARIMADLAAPHSSGTAPAAELAGLAALLPGIEPATRCQLLESLLFSADGQRLTITDPVWKPNLPSRLLLPGLPQHIRERWFPPSTDSAAPHQPLLPLQELVRSAVAANLSDELEKRLLQPLQQGHPPARFARLLLRLELNQMPEAAADALNLLRRQRTQDPAEQQLDQQLFLVLQQHRRNLPLPSHPPLIPTAPQSLAVAARNWQATAKPLPSTGLLWCEDPEFGRSEGPLLHPASVSSDGVLLHQTSRSPANCPLPWPVTGPLRFSLRTLLEPALQAGTAYDGFAVTTAAASDRTLAAGLGSQATLSRSGRWQQPGEFGSQSVRVDQTIASFAVNGHPVWQMPAEATAFPWLALHVDASSLGVFSRLQLSEPVTIPREICLSADPALRGWSAHRYGQLLPLSRRVPVPGTAGSAPNSTAAPGSDWSVTENLISGRTVDDAGMPGETFPTATLAFLQYQRPLQPGDKLTWEFDYQPGSAGDCIALGSLAIRLRPEGVFVHGIPASPAEWTLFPPECEHRVESLAGAAPALLPGWNAAALQIEPTRALLFVNQQQVLELPLEPLADTRPGLCFRRNQTPLRIRQLVLSGDWPAQFTNAALQELLQKHAADEHRPPADSLAAEWVRGRRAAEVLRESRETPPEQRWQLLADCVLPGATDSALQTAGVYIESSLFDVTSPGVDSPLQAWIRLAVQSGNLPQLQERLQQIPETNHRATVERAAALTLCAVIARQPQASERLAELLRLLQNTPAADTIDSNAHRAPGNEPDIPWLLLAVVHEAHNRPELAELLLQLMDTAAFGQFDQHHSADNTVQSLQSLLAGLRTRLRHTTAAQAGTETPLANTTTAPPDSPVARLQTWQLIGGSMALNAVAEPASEEWLALADGSVLLAHRSPDACCLFPKPLTGDFVFEFTARTPALSEHHLRAFPIVGFGGVCWLPNPDGSLLELPWRDPLPEAPPHPATDTNPTATPPATPTVVKRRCRLERRGLQLQLTLDDKTILQQTLTGREPPWLVLRCGPTPGAVIEQLRIEAAADHTALVPLPFNPQLTGWDRPPFGRSELFRPEQQTDADWRTDEARLTGTFRSESAGTWRPNLLQFMAPLPPRGRISWAFRYEPGRKLVHPTVGSVVLLLEPGIGISAGELPRILDTNTELSQSALHAARQRLQDSRCELSTDAWQQATLEIDGANLLLQLNGTPAAQLLLRNPQNRRFGFFHWSDQTAAEINSLQLEITP